MCEALGLISQHLKKRNNGRKKKGGKSVKIVIEIKAKSEINGKNKTQVPTDLRVFQMLDPG